ncbi:MAG: signal peptidase I [Oscillospiraceae bacterium]|jgi:signal peptidase I|nr:signal peptidase I [Oscillospiraceae bacterium]
MDNTTNGVKMIDVNEAAREFERTEKEYMSRRDTGIPVAGAAQSDKPKPAKVKRLGNVMFYLTLVLVIAGAFFFRTVGGYSFYTVLTKSMQSEIPQGSLVISERVDPNTIQLGDDVTYLREDNSTITHRVVGIIENYEDTGERGFTTQGIENEMPDLKTVFSANVVGIVRVSIPHIGTALFWIAENVVSVLAVLGVLLILRVSLNTFFSEKKREKEKSETTTQP